MSILFCSMAFAAAASPALDGRWGKRPMLPFGGTRPPSAHSSWVVSNVHAAAISAPVLARLALAQKQLRAAGRPFIVTFFVGETPADRCPLEDTADLARRENTISPGRRLESAAAPASQATAPNRSATCASSKPNDVPHAECQRFCDAHSAKSHCLWCKCRRCSYCGGDVHTPPKNHMPKINHTTKNHTMKNHTMKNHTTKNHGLKHHTLEHHTLIKIHMPMKNHTPKHHSRTTTELAASNAGKRQAAQRALVELRSVLGNATVVCVDPQRFVSTWPNFFPTIATLPDSHGRPAARTYYSAKPSHSGAPVRWSWTSCDLHAFTAVLPQLRAAANSHKGGAQDGHKGGGAAAPFDYVWNIDYDIGWTGDLAAILSAFDDERADLLTTDLPVRATAEIYEQLRVRNYMGDDEVYKALLVPARYSRRLLLGLDGLVSRGQHTYCEARASSFCHKSHSWCTYRGMRQLRPELFDAKFGCCNAISEAMLTRMRQEDEAAGKPAGHRGKLVHRVRDVFVQGTVGNRTFTLLSGAKAVFAGHRASGTH